MYRQMRRGSSINLRVAGDGPTLGRSRASQKWTKELVNVGCSEPQLESYTVPETLCSHADASEDALFLRQITGHRRCA